MNTYERSVDRSLSISPTPSPAASPSSRSSSTTKQQFLWTNIDDNKPFARILYDGVFVALISTNGTIIYSQVKGDAIFGSFSSTRGRNILDFIRNSEGKDMLESFFSQNGKQSPEMCSQFFGKSFFETRFGHIVSFEITPNFSLKDVSNDNVSELLLPPRTGLLSLANLQSSVLSDELSFNDAFG